MERPEERPERRKNDRLRMLIDDLQSQLRDTRYALEFVRDSVAQLRVDVEDLRRAHNEERPLITWSSSKRV
jgi:predicted  nucleic acid-binding Zn-ribbon protein